MDKENVNPSSVLDVVPSTHGASVFDAVPSTAIATAGALVAPAGASEAAAGGGQILPEWDPYEQVSYIRPSNPYDTCMDDPWNEVTMVCSLVVPLSFFNPIFDGSLVTIRADL
jgi:hypothetical protein